MFRDVRQYVRQCIPCQKYKSEQRQQAGKMLTRQVSEPFGILCADFVGPLPRSKKGNNMLLVFFDTFTKWVELTPLRKATTATLIRAFRERIISHFGAPRKLVCDNGSPARRSRTSLKKREWNPNSPPILPTGESDRARKSRSQDDDRPVRGERTEQLGQFATRTVTRNQHKCIGINRV